VPVRVSRGDVKVVEDLSLLYEVFWNLHGELAQEAGYDVSPGFLPERLVQRFDGLFSGLLRGKTGPFVPACRL
jgi:hypothetical protein